MKIIQRLKIGLILAAALTFVAPSVDAQCPMCRMAVESNLKAGGKAGKGLNTGILYMLATPYLLVGALAFVWWRNRRRNVDEDPETEG
jgi:hypothetical protein